MKSVTLALLASAFAASLLAADAPVRISPLNISSAPVPTDIGRVYDEDAVASPPQRVGEARPEPNSELVRKWIDAGIAAYVDTTYIVDKTGAVREIEISPATVTIAKQKTPLDPPFVNYLVDAKILPETARKQSLAALSREIGTAFEQMATAYLAKTEFKPGTRSGTPIAVRCRYGFGWSTSRP